VESRELGSFEPEGSETYLFYHEVDRRSRFCRNYRPARQLRSFFDDGGRHSEVLQSVADHGEEGRETTSATARKST
jgi:hypothetical protein